MGTKRSTLKLYTKVIPANSQIGPLAMGGTLFHVKESNGVFQVAFDDSDFSDVEVGIQFKEGDDFAPFKRVFLRNQTALPLTVQIYIGTGRSVIDARLNTLVDRVITVSVAGGKNAPTYTKGTATAISGGGDAFTGLDGVNPRKSFSVRNKEAAGSGNNISVTGANGTEIYNLPPQESFIVESGGTINLIGGVFAYAVCEVFYSP